MTLSRSRRRHAFFAVLVAFIVYFLGARHLTARTAPTEVNRPTVVRSQNLNFIRNTGIASRAVRYVAQPAGAGFYFETSRAVFTFNDHRGTGPADGAAQSGSIALRFIDANPQVQIEARTRATGVVNYLVGK